MIDKKWIPTKRQEDFLSIPDTIFEALYGGAAGGGKTETLLMLPVSKVSSEGKPLYEYPRFKVLYLRRTYPELKKEVIPRSREIYPHFGFGPFNSTDKVWTHSSGSMIQFGHCEHEKDVAQYDTSEYNMILWDEVTSFTAFMYEYISFTRCRTSNPFLPKIIRAGTNPGNIGHAYFRKRFVAPAREGNVILREHRILDGQDTVVSRIYIPSKATDNTYLMQADPDYINRLNKLPPAEKAAKLDGDWWIFSGQVFDDFRTQPLVGESETANHICDPFTIPYYWPRILAIDWGYSALTVKLAAAINPEPSQRYPGKIYIYKESTARRQKIAEWGADTAREFQGENFIDIVMDPSAWINRGDEGGTVEQQFSLASGFQPRKADNDRISGKLLLQEYLRFQPRPKKFLPTEGFNHELFLKIRRNNGPKAADDYYNTFQPEEAEQFLPKLKIFSTCTGIIENLPKCVYVVDSGRKSEENPEGLAEDVAELKNDVDDYYDTVRYLIKACQYYLDNGIFEHNKVQQQAKIEQRLENTGNLTQYFIDMADVDTSPERNKVRRFSRRRLKYANF